MQQPSSRLPKAVAEAKRQRDVFLLYGLAFRDIPRIDTLGPSSDTSPLPPDHVPQPSSDSALTAFAQLACMRLGTKRALISLIDDNRQHVLAEATPDLLLRAGSHHHVPNSLWLGSVSIPRSWGVCEQVLNVEPATIATGEHAVVIIDDLSQSSTHSRSTYVKEGPRTRFYAGVGLTSPAGSIVGTLCVMDDTPRPGISHQDVLHLQDLAVTIGEYLDTYTLRDQYRRGEQMTRGLVSFSEGGSTLRAFEDESQPSSAARFKPPAQEALASPKPAPPKRTASLDDTASSGKDGLRDLAPPPLARGPTVSGASSLTVTSGHGSIRALQDSILPTNSKAMFARAANIMRASSDLDGVLILDASVAGGKVREWRRPEPTGSSDITLDSTGESEISKSSGSDDSAHHVTYWRETPSRLSTGKRCQVLGYAAADQNAAIGMTTKHGIPAVPESDLTRMLRKFPDGKVLSFSVAGELLSSSSDVSDSSSTTGTLASNEPSGGSRSKVSSGRLQRTSKMIREMFPNARSVAFVPLWDYDRSRWFAGCLLWSNNQERLLSERADLAYFKVFGSSIMTELSRLDALASSKAKTSFVASISHELRSPLHGILGTLEFLKDTQLDSFQGMMLTSLAACGQTLLDTINHILDYAKISETTRQVSSKKLRGNKTVRLSSKPLKKHRMTSPQSREGSFDLSVATEEVVEAVFAGQSYLAISSDHHDEPMSPTERPRRRKTCYVILDLGYDPDWIYCLPIGPWRRIVMNIFGNALKYTETGHIHVSLMGRDQSRSTDRTANVTLTITDSGSGIGPHFLANRVFQPFSQENPHSDGTGLGLSIVRQIIETIGGKVEISSDHAIGTKLTVRLALVKPENMYEIPPQRKKFLATQPRLKGRRICILRTSPSPSDEMDEFQSGDGLTYFSDALARTLTDHLGMDVIQTTSWRGHEADIVICPEASFPYLSAIREERSDGASAPMTIFVAMDQLEAATLRSDVRVTSKESVVEIMTQPCGPYKLATVLDQCLNRFSSPDENLESGYTVLQTPLTSDPARPGAGETEAMQADYFGTQTTVPADSPADLNEDLPANLPGDLPAAELPANDVVVPILDTTPQPSTAPETSKAEEPKPIIPATTDMHEKPNEYHVLITDDNSINRKLLVAFLKKRKNVRYKEAVNGLEALQAYQDSHVRFDVILMDVSMPVMDGMTATRRIREYEQKHGVPRCFIIALTGLTSASARLEAWSSGVDHYMTKPVDFKELSRLLQEEEQRRLESVP